MQVVMHAGHRRVIVANQRAQRSHEFDVDGIEEWRRKPFEKRRVRLGEKPKCLSYVPPTEIDLIDDRLFNNVPPCLQVDGEVPMWRANVNESYVVVAVARGKAPGTTAGFNCAQDANITRRLDHLESVSDFSPYSAG